MPRRYGFFVTIPHSGEIVPEEATWLKGLPEIILMCDVDRYVDKIYAPLLEKMDIPFVSTPWHRYVVDLNRFATDVDESTVEGSSHPKGSFNRGLLWSVTTKGDTLMNRPITQALHSTLVEKYFDPFHEKVRSRYQNFKNLGAEVIYHIDAHSMPSVGTSMHRDPGQTRADVVVSDCSGKSCPSNFKDLVISSYEKAGFSVAYNWPYVGGRITEQYGQPDKGQYAIQVELSRSQYMDEFSKKAVQPKLEKLREKVSKALTGINEGLQKL